MKYWLIKSEPEEYSMDDLLSDNETVWSGVRNYAARNFLKEMSKNDICFFYHSVNEKQIVGIAKVSKTFYFDPTFEDHEKSKNNWVAVNISPLKKVKKTLTLNSIKENFAFEGFQIIKNSRLSVMPVSNEHAILILKLCETTL